MTLKIEKDRKKQNKARKREYKTHAWMIAMLKNQKKVATFKYNKFDARLAQLDEDFAQATGEYMRKLLDIESYRKAKKYHKSYSARVKQWRLVWKERIEYLDALIEHETELAEKAYKKI